MFLVKVISLVFELGTALIAAALVWHCVEIKRQERSIRAFALVWLAPNLLYNGPAWGQADSIWTFFVLFAVFQFIRGRQLGGVCAFGAGFAMKAQAAFLGPFVLGLLARGNPWRVLWLGLVPLVYLAVSIPVLLAGRPFSEVAMVYGNQAGKYHFLSSNAASMWILVPWFPYNIGVVVGLAVGIAAALALAWVIARSPRRDFEFVLLSASASLIVLPYVLPMMHDRYFYAYEIATIVLACVNLRYVAFAVIAQVNCMLAYVAYDLGVGFGVRIAAISNAIVIFFLLRELAAPRFVAHFPRAEWVRYGLSVVATGIFLALSAKVVPTAALKIGSTAIFGGALGVAGFQLLARSLVDRRADVGDDAALEIFPDAIAAEAPA